MHRSAASSHLHSLSATAVPMQRSCIAANERCAAAAAPMRVVFVLPTYLPESFGGAEQQTRKLGLALARLGIHVTLLAPRLHKGTAKREQDGPISVHRLRLGQLPNLGGRHMTSFLLWAAKVFWWLARNRERYDVIHIIHGRLHALPAALAGAALKKPTLIKIGRGGIGHFDLDLVERKRWFGPWYARTLVRHTSAYVANSRTIVTDLERWRVPAARIHEIPNGVDVPAIEAAHRAWDVPHLIYLGRLDEEKCIDVLIRGFAQLPADSHATLTIVGDGHCRRALEALSQELRLGERVRFTGAVTDTAAVLERANTYVSCSVSEGMSNALLEAMSCGLMPLVSLVSGVADIVEDDTSGMLFEPGNLQAFVDRLQDAVALPPERRRELGTKARIAVQARFGIDDVAARHGRLYEQLARC